MSSFWLDTHPIRSAGEPLRPGTSWDTVVVGAGLTGVVSALLLVRAGQQVALVEAGRVGALTTGHTTAKVSLLQGSVLSEVKSRHGTEILQAYVDSNRAGQSWLADAAQQRDVEIQSLPAWTYVTTPDHRERLEEEFQAALAAHLDVSLTPHAGLPFPVLLGLRLPDQLQLHPTELLDALLWEFLDLGGVLHTRCQVNDVTVAQRCSITTEHGVIAADQVVLATGTPILDRGAHFARLTPQRSYALAATVPGQLPPGMYLSLDSPARSLRPAGADSSVLIVGGNGHRVGTSTPTRARVQDLVDWTTRWFPGASVSHTWSAQDYIGLDRLPQVGQLPFSGGRIHLATGYQKWGMATAVAAALRIEAAVTGGDPPDWAVPLAAARPLSGLVDAVHSQLSTLGEALTGVGRAVAPLPAESPPEGHGVVGRCGWQVAGRSTVGSLTRTVSAVCPHLGGILTWNDAELSWDCPLHGSRFDASGRRREGPARSDLRQL